MRECDDLLSDDEAFDTCAERDNAAGAFIEDVRALAVQAGIDPESLHDISEVERSDVDFDFDFARARATSLDRARADRVDRTGRADLETIRFAGLTKSRGGRPCIDGAVYETRDATERPSEGDLWLCGLSGELADHGGCRDVDSSEGVEIDHPTTQSWVLGHDHAGEPRERRLCKRDRWIIGGRGARTARDHGE
jgi:hypothetical protein